MTFHSQEHPTGRALPPSRQPKPGLVHFFDRFDQRAACGPDEGLMTENTTQVTCLFCKRATEVK